MQLLTKKSLTGFFALSLVTSLNFIIPSPSTAAGTPVKGGDLVVVRGDIETSLVPSIPPDNASIWVLEELFDTLLFPAADGKSLVPGLATTWSQSKDGLTWTFNLRKGVKFSDGTAMTSKDVKFSIEENTKGSNWGFLNASISKITTPNADTVLIKTKYPYSPLPAAIATFANSVLPYNYGGKTQEEFGKNPIGTGPFKISKWTLGQQIKLVKNPYYWEAGKPYLNSITFNLVPDSNTRANQLLGGQAQINEFPPYSSVKALKGQSKVTVSAFPSSATMFMVFNNSKAPFNDPHLRKALAYVIDKKAINTAILAGAGTPAGAFMWPSGWAHNAAIKGREFDVAKAKAELALSTTPTGLTANIAVASGNVDQNSLAQIMQNAAAQIGVTLNIQQLDPSAMNDARMNKTFDICYVPVTTDMMDPDEIINVDAVYTGGAFSLFSYYDNKNISKWAADAVKTQDQAKRKVIYDKIQVQFEADAPMVPLYYAPEMYSYSKKVQNFHSYVTGNYNLRNVWLSK
jgi:peptide/nickel transport system substrate-binding protein